MSSIGSVSNVYSAGISRLPNLTRPEGPSLTPKLPELIVPSENKPTPGFGQVFNNLVGAVDEKQKASAAETRDVLIGKSENIHQAVIAMQEAGVAFQLMVEVRNKVVESYQELMRMPV